MALKVLYSAEKTKGYGLLFQPFSHMTMALFGTSLAIKRWLHLLILGKKNPMATSFWHSTSIQHTRVI